MMRGNEMDDNKTPKLALLVRGVDKSCRKAVLKSARAERFQPKIRYHQFSRVL